MRVHVPGTQLQIYKIETITKYYFASISNLKSDKVISLRDRRVVVVRF